MSTTVYLLWDESISDVKVFSSKENAINFINKINEQNKIIQKLIDEYKQNYQKYNALKLGSKSDYKYLKIQYETQLDDIENKFNHPDLTNVPESRHAIIIENYQKKYNNRYTLLIESLKQQISECDKNIKILTDNPQYNDQLWKELKLIDNPPKLLNSYTENQIFEKIIDEE